MADWMLKTEVYEGIAARQRLADLDLDLDLLVEVVEKGERARAEATAHDPAIAASWDAWRYRVRGLRDAFVSRGWTPERSPSGLEYLRSPCRRRAILTRARNSEVGVPNGRPQPLRGFGDATARALEANGSLHLDPDWQNVVPANDEILADFETWMLLVHRSGDLVQAELSHPSGQGDDGRVDRWIERIVLPAIDYTDDPSGRKEETTSEAEEVDVPVVRKR